MIFSKKHFTLIELLVVIAIISILASMLLPALNRARSSARKVHCVSNQKQTTLATFQYLDDNNDTFMNSVGGGTGWKTRVAPYLYPDLPVTGGYANLNSLDSAGEPTMFSCPEHRIYYPDYDSWWELLGTASNVYIDNQTVGLYVKLVKMKKPSMTAWTIDAVVSMGMPFGYSSWALDFWQGPKHCHGGKANIAYLDAHVDSRSNDPVDAGDSSYGQDDNEGKPIWNWDRPVP